MNKKHIHPEKKIKLTLIRSISGRLPKHQAMAATLGLRRINQSVEVTDRPEMRGIITKIPYLLKIEEVK